MNPAPSVTKSQISRTTFSQPSRSAGLTMCLLAPSSKMRFTSSGSLEPLRMTTGTAENKTEGLRQARKSNPFTSGIFKSRTITSGKRILGAIAVFSFGVQVIDRFLASGQDLKTDFGQGFIGGPAEE